MKCAKCGCDIGSWVTWISDCHGKLFTVCQGCAPPPVEIEDWGPVRNMPCLIPFIKKEKKA